MRQMLLKYLQGKARRRLRIAGVTIHPTAKVNFRAILHRLGSSITIGEGSLVEGSLTCEREGVHLAVGRNSFIGNDTILASAVSITVGDDVLISSGCRVLDHNSHAVGWNHRKQDVRDWYAGKKDWTHVPCSPIRIEDKAWIGLNVIVLRGVTLGEGCIIGAGSVVTKSVPPWCIAAGNPAKVLRELRPDERTSQADLDAL